MTKSPTDIVPSVFHESSSIYRSLYARTIDYSLSSEEHHHSERRREDDILARVQIRQGSRDLNRRLLVRREVLVVLRDLILLVIEVLYKSALVSCCPIANTAALSPLRLRS